jgi:alpha-L-rhamnosidase
MGYSVEKREFNNSEWVYASDDFLKKAENIESIEGVKWIWPVFYVRVYLRKYFTLDKVVPTKALFICDNVFDLFINGKPVSLNKKRFSGDITHFLTEGENRINIRSYQTDDDRFITSAITGIIENADMRIPTDESWEGYIPVTFWENDEPKDWQIYDQRNNNNPVLTAVIHPRLYKRSVYLRKRFNIEAPIERAMLYVSTQGLSETYINGARTDNEFFADGICQTYREFHVYDVTGLIKMGANVLGAITGNGWLNSESHSSVYMNKNMFISELEITYVDGRTEIIGTDKDVKMAFSPFTDNDLQYGERYDARLEIDNWCSPSLDDGTWQGAETVDPKAFDPREFIKRNYPPVYAMRKLKPVKTMMRDTRIIYDFGENCAGRYSVILNNTYAGQEIKFSMCERLDEFGEFIVGLYCPPFFNRDGIYDGKSRGCMRNFDFYTCKGGKTEEYEPRFTFTGFRYLCIEGIRDRSQVESIEMNVMHNALKRTGYVESEYSLINTLYDMTVRTWYSNIVNGPMDCPTREKNFWTGDMHIFSATACYLSDCDDFLARWTHAGRKICTEVYGWGDEKYIIPWTLYQFYRDKGVLEQCYDGIVEYARARCATAQRGLPVDTGNGFSDWLAPDGLVLDKYFFSCTFYCYMLKVVAQIAEVMGDYKTSDEFAAMVEPAIDAFNKRFFDNETNEYTPRTQSSIVIPLAFGLVPVHREKLLAQKLNEMILKEGHLTTGFVATRHLMGILCDYGYKDTAFMLLDREEYPSWKHMIKGLTTMPETWVGITDTNDEKSVSMNHFAFGSVVGWMFEYLGGIRYKESTPGFSHVVLRPTFIKEIGTFKADLNTVYGPISVEWQVDGDKVRYTFSSQRNVTLILPDGTVKAYPKGEHTVTTVM